jgi:1-phosphofructokinase
MILTLTLNPSLDRTVDIAELTRGAVIRAGSARLDPGGKGVNVTRALLANGAPSRAVLPCGGDEGNQLARLLHAEGVDVIAVPIAAHTRSNISLAERDGTITKINEPGAPLSPAELDAIVAAVARTAARPGWVAACGSLPPGVPTGFYADLCRRCAEQGIQVAVDTSGPALLAAIEARPALIKPNRDELAAAVGHPITTIQDAVDAAQVLRSRGAQSVLASLGADGAVLVCGDGVTVGEADVSRPRSTVGAGDALLAGFLAAGAHGPDAVAEALAWASAAVALPGSRMPGPPDIQRSSVRIHPGPDLSRQLVTPL